MVSIIWTEEMLEALIKFRTVDKLNMTLCAEKLGIGEVTCRKKAIELGLNKAVRRGRLHPPDPVESLERRRRLQREWKQADRKRRPDYYRNQANQYNAQRRKQAADD